MTRKTATKEKKPRKPKAKKEEPIVCNFCGGKGYIELDKVGLLITPCYNCEKGRAQAVLMGAPTETKAEDAGTVEVPPDAGTDIKAEDMGDKETPDDNGDKGIPDDNGSGGTGQPDKPTGSPDTGKSEQSKEPETTEPPTEESG